MPQKMIAELVMECPRCGHTQDMKIEQDVRFDYPKCVYCDATMKPQRKKNKEEMH